MSREKTGTEGFNRSGPLKYEKIPVFSSRSLLFSVYSVILTCGETGVKKEDHKSYFIHKRALRKAFRGA